MAANDLVFPTKYSLGKSFCVALLKKNRPSRGLSKENKSSSQTWMCVFLYRSCYPRGKQKRNLLCVFDNALSGSFGGFCVIDSQSKRKLAPSGLLLALFSATKKERERSFTTKRVWLGYFVNEKPTWRRRSLWELVFEKISPISMQIAHANATSSWRSPLRLLLHSRLAFPMQYGLMVYNKSHVLEPDRMKYPRFFTHLPPSAQSLAMRIH